MFRKAHVTTTCDASERNAAPLKAHSAHQFTLEMRSMEKAYLTKGRIIPTVSLILIMGLYNPVPATAENRTQTATTDYGNNQYGHPHQVSFSPMLRLHKC